MNELWSNIRHSYPDSGTRRPAAGEKLLLRIDDRNQRDVYPGFCDIHVTVPDPDAESFILELRHPPLNAEVREYVERHDGQCREERLGTLITFQLTATSGPWVIGGLALVIGRVTRRGQRYQDPNWKWICPRAADALKRFARALASTGSRRAQRSTV